jgi:hypothetical protein
MSRSAYPVLSPGRLNRATLHRQLLLQPADLAVGPALERLGGLQAQEAASPYLALWARLRHFDAASLDRAIANRQAIKATLMRATLHIVTRNDYLRLLPALRPSLHGQTRRNVGGPPADLAAVTEAAHEFATKPRGNVELREFVGGLVSDLSSQDAWWWVRRAATLVHAPGSGQWSFGRRPWLVSASAWLDGASFAAEAASIEHLVRRHLGSFGPASAADIAAWSGLPAGRLRTGVEALEGAGELRRFSDERGRVLLDLVDAPLPDAAVPAPPRLLPMWASVRLAHADRTRVMSDADRARVIGRNGDVLPTFFVDGRVGGLWWAETDRGTARIVLEPFRPLARGVRRALDDLGSLLAAFVGAREPAVYGRYRASRARRR